MTECPVGRGACPDLPVAGPDGVVRHLLAVHPEAPLTRSIFAALVRVQLTDVDTAAEVTIDALTGHTAEERERIRREAMA